jgi:DNA-binding NarL/FixJ family response regulator
MSQRSLSAPTPIPWRCDRRPDREEAAARFSINGRECLVVRGRGTTKQRGRKIRVGSLTIEGTHYAILLEPPEVDDEGDVLHVLTPRELEIAMLVAAGQVNKQIAANLKISFWTVATHLNRIFCKLGVRTRAEMTARIVSRLARS